MKMKAIVIAAAAMLCGCVNMYTRCPWTDEKIERTYQSTGVAYSFAIVAAWPQIMSDSPGNNGFMPENLISIPVGCAIMCDAACEAVIDTVCLPVDIVLSKRSDKKGE